MPHQPSAQFPFPKRVFSKQCRSFQHSWFTQWKFLYYDEANDIVFCHTCVSAFKQGKMKSSCAEPAFVSVAAAENATGLFQKHAMHKQAVEVMIVLPSTTKDVSELLVTQLAREKEHNHRMFLKLFLASGFFRWHYEGIEMMKTAIFQIYWNGLNERPTSIRTSHEIQNDIIKVMADVLTH